MRERPLETWRRTLLDSFDWRLIGAGKLWYAKARTGVLTWEPKGARRSRRQSVESVPAFRRDLPEGEVWKTVGEALGIRRLLARLELVEKRRRLDLLDAEEKVVARLAIVQASAQDPDTGRAVGVAPWVEVESLRGYPDGDRATELLIEELDLEQLDADGFEQGLKALGLKAGVDPSKPTAELEPDDDARHATTDALIDLFGILRANEPGTRADLDIEFLHDFRVALRRTRSVLSDFGPLFVPEALERWKEELRWLGGVTGPTRDLDVLLHNWSSLVGDLDADTRERLEPLYTVAKARREAAFVELRRALDSDRYARIVDGWPRFLAALKETPPTAGELEEVVGRRLWRRFKRVRKAGSALVPDSPAEDFHRVRIHGKKLRYILEVYKSLWGASEVKSAVKALKRFQDHLGDFNDAEVHAGLVRELAENSRLEPRVVLAAGELIELLRRRADDERQRFFEFFGSFVADENRTRYRRLSGKGKV